MILPFIWGNNRMRSAVGRQAVVTAFIDSQIYEK